MIAQDTFFNNADVVFVNTDAEVHIFGNILSTGNTTLLSNQGLIQTYNDLNNGDFELNNGATVQSKGDYKIEKDWINNATLLIDSGLVELYGANQFIKGSQVSFFWNVLLTGTDKKELDIDAHVKSVIDITNLEFAVHDKTLFLDSSAQNALLFDASLLNSEGIISTDEDGTIRKNLNFNEPIVIPTGSSFTTFRHRPIVVNKLNGSSKDTARITFHNHSPNLLNLLDTQKSDSICEIQTRYFYTFNAGEPNSDFQLDFAHLPPTDDEYLHLATWNTNLWNKVNNKSNFSSGNYQYVRANSISNFVDQHFTLSRITPIAPFIQRDTIICYQNEKFRVETPQNEPNYSWSIENGVGSAIILTGQGTDEILTNWGTSLNGFVYVRYQDINGCYSFNDSIKVSNGSVIADFGVLSNNLNFDSEILFLNQSSSSTTDVEWVIQGNSDVFSGNQTFNPYTYSFNQSNEIFEYEVMLIAHSDLGNCYDTVRELIRINDLFVFYAPTIFTPNGDGVNDLFHAETSRIEKLTLSIYNRWGELIFSQEGSDPLQVAWDGKYRGNEVQLGAYTYIFKVWPKNKSFYGDQPLEYSGTITPLK